MLPTPPAANQRVREYGFELLTQLDVVGIKIVQTEELNILLESVGDWRAFDYDELLTRDKASLDIFWLRDESLEDTANLPDPDVVAAEIADDLRTALEEFEAIQGDLGPAKPADYTH